MIIPYEDAMLQVDRETLARWDDEVVPGEVELLPHTHYSPVYAWMYAYEKQLKRRIEKVVGHPLGRLERVLFGQDGVVSEALSNAFLHGHGRDAKRTIHVGIRVLRSTLVVTVRDEGPGFDVASALKALGEGAAYYHMAGNGLRCLAESTLIRVSYTDGGRVLVLQVPL